MFAKLSISETKPHFWRPTRDPTRMAALRMVEAFEHCAKMWIAWILKQTDAISPVLPGVSFSAVQREACNCLATTEFKTRRWMLLRKLWMGWNLLHTGFVRMLYIRLTSIFTQNLIWSALELQSHLLSPWTLFIHFIVQFHSKVLLTVIFLRSINWSHDQIKQKRVNLQCPLQLP